MSENKKTKKKKILMIDDDPMFVKLYEMTAESHDEFELITAPNIYEGDKKTRSEKPDLILLDLILGKDPDTPIRETDKSHGFDFLLLIKRDPEVRDIPIIILSNLDTKQDRERAQSLQASNYLMKAENSPEEVFSAALAEIDLTAAAKKIREIQKKDPYNKK